MTKGNRKSYSRRVLRKKLNREAYFGLTKMMGHYCRFNYGSGV